MQTITKYYKLLFLLCILVFINFLFGPLVRATDSGLACPDWPFCYGEMLPNSNSQISMEADKKYSIFQIYMEVGHRFYSGLISIVFLIFVIFTYQNKELRSYFKYSTLLAILLLISQILLGMYTVTKLLNPTTVNLHLINAIVFFLVLISILIRVYHIKNNNYRSISWLSIFKPKHIFHFIVLFFVFYQIHVGAKVSSNKAGLACTDFPKCVGSFWMPPKDEYGKRSKLGLIHIEHRYLAYFVFLLILALQMIAIGKKWSHPSKIFIKMSFHTVFLQIIIGILNVLFRLPPLITMFHTGLAVLIITFLFISFMIRLIEHSTSSIT